MTKPIARVIAATILGLLVMALLQCARDSDGEVLSADCKTMCTNTSKYCGELDSCIAHCQDEYDSIKTASCLRETNRSMACLAHAADIRCEADGAFLSTTCRTFISRASICKDVEPSDASTDGSNGPTCYNWAQSSTCEASGANDQTFDLTCDEMIPSTSAGYCYCSNGAVPADCGHRESTCKEVCRNMAFPTDNDN